MTITIHKAPGTWVARTTDGVIAETNDALELTEGNYPPVIYFPRADIGMAFLDASDHTTHCPHKGDASYFHIVGKSETARNAGWSYETPKPEAKQIAGHIAFYGDKVAVERV